MLENAAGEEANELAGEGTTDILDSTTEEESDEDSSGSLLGAFLGRRVSDVEVPPDSG